MSSSSSNLLCAPQGSPPYPAPNSALASKFVAAPSCAILLGCFTPPKRLDNHEDRVGAAPSSALCRTGSDCAEAGINFSSISFKAFSSLGKDVDASSSTFMASASSFFLRKDLLPSSAFSIFALRVNSFTFAVASTSVVVCHLRTLLIELTTSSCGNLFESSLVASKIAESFNSRA